MTKHELLDNWKNVYDDLKDSLAQIGDRADSYEYNLLATQAMSLHECILGLVEMDDAGN